MRVERRSIYTIYPEKQDRRFGAKSISELSLRVRVGGFGVVCE